MKRNGIIFIFSLIILLFWSCSSKLQFPKEGLTLGFYNLENLFDTIDDPKTDDKDWLPEGKSKWDSERYNHKMNQMAKVIASMDTLSFPHILGLSEVENATVLDDLISNPQLKKANYSSIHFEGKDPRGIEVAMIYRSKFFKPVLKKELKVRMKETSAEMRYVLYVKGVTALDDTLHIFVNHWTSRFGGREQTNKKRLKYGQTLKSISDSLFRADSNANIIICGDLNDNPTDKSILEGLQTLVPSDKIEDLKLYNLSAIPFTQGKGSLYYDGWEFYDQIIVSSNLLKKNADNLKTSDIQIVKHPWMLFKYKKEFRPNRTISGNKYFGGYSDHLPVMIRLTK